MKQTLDDIELTADESGRRHLTAIEMFFKESRQAMTGFEAFSHAGSLTLRAALQSLAWGHLSVEEDAVENEMRFISQEAHRTALTHLDISHEQTSADAFTELVIDAERAAASYLADEIIAQTGRDVNQVLRDYRNASLRALMLADVSDMSKQEANTSVLIDIMNMRRQRLWFTDRAGRKFPSQKHVRRLWRMTLRDHWVMIYLRTLAVHGETHAFIWHPDPQHKFYGESMKIAEADYGLAEADKIFHPNARALPVARKYMMELT